MQCLQCRTDNKPGRKFCAACGNLLPLPCERCSFTNDIGDRFCGGCGSALATQASPVVSSQLPVASPQPPTPRTQHLDSGLRTSDPGRWTPPHLAERIRAATLTEGECKTITALFADLKGSTALIEGLDPEEARAIIDPALQGLWEYYQSRVDHQRARDLADQMLRYAQEKGDPTLLLVAHDVQADTLAWLGKFTVAREHAEAGIRLYDPKKHHALTFTYGGYDPGLVCHCYATFTLWSLGYPDQAVERIKATLSLAYQLVHPFSLSWALCFAAMLAHFVGNERAAIEWLEALRGVSDEQGFAFWSPWAPILGGRIRTGQGYGEEEIVGMQEGLTAWQATGTELLRPWFLTLLAESYGHLGQIEKGLDTVVEALSIGTQTGERWSEAEGYRVKGELALQSKVKNPKSKVEEAEECFLKAIDIARKQQAKSWELRASTSLTRLWQSQGKHHEARIMLSAIYSWFTEGFDTKDLQEAKVLLEELSH